MSKHPPLAPLKVGDSVVLQDPKSDLWDIRGKITKIRNNGRSYWVETLEGESYLRGRPMIRNDISPGEDMTLTSRQDSDSDRQSDSQVSQDTDSMTVDSRDTGCGPRQAGVMTADRETRSLSTHGDRRLDSQDTDTVLRRTRSETSVRFDT